MQLRERFSLRTYIGLSIVGLGCGFVGAMGGAKIASVAMPIKERVAIEIPVTEISDEVRMSSSSITHGDAAPAPSDDVAFVMVAEDTNYMVLPIDPATLPHVTSRIVKEEYASTTIAQLHDKDLTRELRAWKGIDVLVDNKCRTTLHDFAVIHTLTGDPVYAGEETNNGKWTRALIDKNGAAYVVAKLETCSGEYARAASAPAAVTFDKISNGETREESTALADLKKSPIEAAARASLAQQAADGQPESDDFDKVVHYATFAAKDPRTSTEWIVIHANADFMCGGPDVNFWGLYRVEPNGSVTRVAGGEAKVSEISALVDLDDDGIPEIRGSGWIAPQSAFYDRDLATLLSYDVPFFGCPC
ncbi:MAG: hypothetical protein QM831_18840 [Kofleriaceae bacterium]